MTGTSIDGVDYALCKVSLSGIKLIQHWNKKFTPTLRERLHSAARNACSSYEIGQLHHDFGRFCAAHAHQASSAPDLVGFHGQTIFHNPNCKQSSTFQIGEPVYLAKALKAPVVSNFRAADLATGGQGAPLATLFHKVVFGKKNSHICFNNLGGISNVSSIHWRVGQTPTMLSFDTGPANVLIDLAVRRLTNNTSLLDQDGRRAARGSISHNLLNSWLRHPYFKKSPPKSAGRKIFGESFYDQVIKETSKLNLSAEDLLATLTEFAAQSIAINYQSHLPDIPEEVIIGGGGAFNSFLISRISNALIQRFGKSIDIKTCDERRWPPETIEPAAFALLAYYRAVGLPANIPNTTGATRSALLGQITEW